MKKFFATLFPREFYHHPQYARALVLGGLFVTLAVLQLFTYEKFYAIVQAYNLPGGNAISFVVAGLIPILEVMALPYLLSMVVSKKLRRVSMIAMIASPSAWLLLSLWTNAMGYDGIETGLMGATLSTMNGLWFVAFCMLWTWACVLVMRELPARTRKTV
jgi:hypothetical protein